MKKPPNNSSSINEGHIEREAWKKSLLTLKALNRMCRRKTCTETQAEHCKLHEISVEWIIELTTKGFTVTEVQCNRGTPLEHPDPSCWEMCQECIQCVSQVSPCLYQKRADPINQLLQTWGFVIIRLICQYKPFQTYQEV